MNIKIATYNICHAVDFLHAEDKAGKKDIDVTLTSKIIKTLSPEIIGLNEVYTGGNESTDKQTEKIAKLCGYEFYNFSNATDFVFKGKPASIGNSILSKHNILYKERIAVPSPKEGERRENENKLYEDRVINYCKINVNGKIIKVISTHFGLNLKEQELMVKKLIQLINNDNLPTILLGDFNCEPHEAILNEIKKRLTSCASYFDNKEFTFSSWEPFTTIDYIFVSKDIKIKDYKVIKEIASDHFPITAEIEI